eukprot:1759169-Rhodomonas_salina.2
MRERISKRIPKTVAAVCRYSAQAYPSRFLPRARLIVDIRPGSHHNGAHLPEHIASSLEGSGTRVPGYPVLPGTKFAYHVPGCPGE